MMDKRIVRRLVAWMMTLVLLAGLVPEGMTLKAYAQEEEVISEDNAAEAGEEAEAEEIIAEEEMWEADEQEAEDQEADITEIPESCETVQEEEAVPVTLEESVDKIKVSVSGYFGVKDPEKLSLYVKRINAVREEEAREAVEEERGEKSEAEEAWYFDIKVLDEEGNELQPADDRGVKLSFEMDGLSGTAQETNIWHIKEDEASGEMNAEKLQTVIEGDTVSAESDGFSVYVLEFKNSVSSLEYPYAIDLQGGVDEHLPLEIPLSDILGRTGLEVEISKITGVRIPDYNIDDLAARQDESGEWIIIVKRFFDERRGFEIQCIRTDGREWATTKTIKFLNGSLSGNGIKDDPYLIKNADDWKVFAESVNDGHHTEAYYKLSDDFDNGQDPVDCPAGKSDMSDFCGVFDGNGRTLYVDMGCAPFDRVDGATIRNLTIAGSIHDDGNHVVASGLVNWVEGENGRENLIDNCVVKADVTAFFTGGVVHDVSKSAVLKISDTVFSGNLVYTGTNAKYRVGGFITEAGNAEVTLNNCYFLGNSETAQAFYHPIMTCSYEAEGKYVGKDLFYTGEKAAVNDFEIPFAGTRVYTDAPADILCSSRAVPDGSSCYIPVEAEGMEPWYHCTGEPFIPEYILKDYDGKILKEGDVTVSLSSELIQEAGNYSLTLTGKGDYSGVAQIPFSLIAEAAPLPEGTEWESGYYVLTEDKEYAERIYIRGKVEIYLNSGKTLTASKGIGVLEGNRLTISGEGRLDATSPDRVRGAAIGGDGLYYSQYEITPFVEGDAGEIIINGGIINAESLFWGAGIGGGGVCGDGGKVVINGGVVNAKGSGGAGIGGGYDYGSGGTIIINGGVVNAVGHGGAGIGGGHSGNSGKISINGGKINASSDDASAGIGGGSSRLQLVNSVCIYEPGGSCDTIEILGGQVTADSKEGYAVGPGRKANDYRGEYTGESGTLVLGWTEITDYLAASTIEASEFQLRSAYHYMESKNDAGEVSEENLSGKDPANMLMAYSAERRPLQGAGTEEDPYMIGNAQDWESFAWNIGTGTESDKCYKLSDDFDNEQEPVSISAGSDYREFRGSFDGNGKTLHIALNDPEKTGAAPFAKVEGVYIHDLIVEGSVCGGPRSSALVGMITGGENRIENCVIRADVNNPGRGGGGQIAGVVGETGCYKLMINNTVCSSALSTVWNDPVAGMLGCAENKATIDMNHCFFKGSISGTDKYNPLATDESDSHQTDPEFNLIDVYVTFPETDSKELKGIVAETEEAADRLWRRIDFAYGEKAYLYADIKGVTSKYPYTGAIPEINLSVSDPGGKNWIEGVDYLSTYTPELSKQRGNYTLLLTAAGDVCGGSVSMAFVVDNGYVNVDGSDELYGRITLKAMLQAGGVVRLIADLPPGEDLEIGAGKEATIDLNGYKLYGNINVGNNSVLTLINS
ncbi:MAG: hypothetical protein K6B44_10200, partial [Lachnospiraceae bacterium]|nr:hypothetical protein [Lachnospiraceae bacterium]